MSGIRSTIYDASAPLPKFVIHRSILRHELRKQRGTSRRCRNFKSAAPEAAPSQRSRPRREGIRGGRVRDQIGFAIGADPDFSDREALAELHEPALADQHAG